MGGKLWELATRHQEAEKQGVPMRKITGTISHPKGETMVTDAIYSIERMPLSTSLCRTAPVSWANSTAMSAPS